MDESTGWEGKVSFICRMCVYISTDSTSVAAVDAGYVRPKEDVLIPLDKRERWCYLVISMLEWVDL